VLVLGAVTWRKAPAVSFGIWFAVFTLLPSSNFLVPSGILLSERTLFLPSAGILIATAAVIPWIYHQVAGRSPRLAAVVFVAVVLAAGIVRSSGRTAVWKDNDTLFQHAVVDAPRVYRTHFILGAWDLAQKRTVKGEREYLAAIALYDRDPYLFYSLGEEYRLWKLNKPAVTMFRRALEADSTLIEAHARMALALIALGDWDQATAEARKALTGDTPSASAMRAIIRMHGRAMKRAREAAMAAPDSLPMARADSGKAPTTVQNTAQSGSKTPASKAKPPK
jgi:tetratricopeptide (TPR) repeat protein